MRLLVDQNGNVLVQLRQCEPAERRSAEVILDLSPPGNWIRGFEMIGGMFDFSLRAAVEPFKPSRPGIHKNEDQLAVTYDPEADAAYFYLPYGARFWAISSDERARATEYSHSINPTAKCALDVNGGLISVLIPTADATGPVDTFLYLFDVEQSVG